MAFFSGHPVILYDAKHLSILRVILHVFSVYGIAHTKDASANFAICCVVRVTQFSTIIRLLHIIMRNSNCCTDGSLVLLYMYAVILFVLY